MAVFFCEIEEIHEIVAFSRGVPFNVLPAAAAALIEPLTPPFNLPLLPSASSICFVLGTE